MSTEQALITRSGNKCELCGSTDSLTAFEVTPSDGSVEQSALLCETCRGQIENIDSSNLNHWRCLNESMWSTESAVQVLAWRQLTQLVALGEVWAQELLDMLYLDPEVQSWAEAGSTNVDDEAAPTLDSNGAPLQAGDSVVIIKDLDVKGTSFVAKRGTAVRNISLTSNPEHIEGRVNGTKIVILTKFVKKS